MSMMQGDTKQKYDCVITVACVDGQLPLIILYRGAERPCMLACKNIQEFWQNNTHVMSL